jgi:hypothetical protein
MEKTRVMRGGCFTIGSYPIDFQWLKLAAFTTKPLISAPYEETLNQRVPDWEALLFKAYFALVPPALPRLLLCATLSIGPMR